MVEPEEPMPAHDSKPKHRARAIQAIAAELCACHFTNGFCAPRDGVCHGSTTRDCMKLADGCMRAMESVGVMVVWPYDKE